MQVNTESTSDTVSSESSLEESSADIISTIESSTEIISGIESSVDIASEVQSSADTSSSSGSSEEVPDGKESSENLSSDISSNIPGPSEVSDVKEQSKTEVSNQEVSNETSLSEEQKKKLSELEAKENIMTKFPYQRQVITGNIKPGESRITLRQMKQIIVDANNNKELSETERSRYIGRKIYEIQPYPDASYDGGTYAVCYWLDDNIENIENDAKHDQIYVHFGSMDIVCIGHTWYDDNGKYENEYGRYNEELLYVFYNYRPLTDEYYNYKPLTSVDD